MATVRHTCGRPLRHRAPRVLLFLTLALVALAGCATLRSQPRYRNPPPSVTPAPQEKDKSRDKLREKEKARAEKEARKARRKDGNKGAGLPSFRIFSRAPSDLVEAAEEYLGVDYRYGGDSSRGMDCSGLVWRAFKDAFDRELPRSSNKMAELGMPVSRVELEPGDLIFFYTGSRGRISHVGIYEGRGRFIHASTTKGVEVASLDEGYWRRRMVCARRISPSSVSD